MISTEQFESDFKSNELIADGEITRLRGNTRFTLRIDGRTLTQVNLSFWYSRKIDTEEDYVAYHGVELGERGTQRVEFTYSPFVAKEIESLPLPHPFDKAYPIFKAISVSQKTALTCIQENELDLATEVIRDGLSLSAVMIGDAAHCVPEIFSQESINRAIWDAIDLCSKIVQSYDDDEEMFARIPLDFYDDQNRYWSKLSRDWALRWTAAHDLPEDYLKSKKFLSHWVKVRRVVELADPGDRSNVGSEILFPNIQRYKAREEERYERRKKRFSDRFERVHAFESRPGIEASELVVRYLDSRPQHDHTTEGGNKQQSTSKAERPRGPSKDRENRSPNREKRSTNSGFIPSPEQHKGNSEQDLSS